MVLILHFAQLSGTVVKWSKERLFHSGVYGEGVSEIGAALLHVCVKLKWRKELTPGDKQLQQANYTIIFTMQ